MSANPLSTVFKLKRVNIFFCDQGGSSAGLRELVKPNGFLYQFAEQNPQIEFYCQLRRGRHPVIEAHYDNGRILSHSVKNKTADQMMKKLYEVRISAGSKIAGNLERKLKNPKQSAVSVQGEWNPFLWTALKEERKMEQKVLRKKMETL